MKKQIFKQTEKKVLAFLDIFDQEVEHTCALDLYLNHNENGGIYGLKNDDDETLYIGQSNNFYRRMMQHFNRSAAKDIYQSEAERERYSQLYCEWKESEKLWILRTQEHNYINAEHPELVRKGIESLLIFKIKPKYNQPFYKQALHSTVFAK